MNTTTLTIRDLILAIEKEKVYLDTPIRIKLDHEEYAEVIKIRRGVMDCQSYLILEGADI